MSTHFNVADHFNTKSHHWDEDPSKLALAHDIAIAAGKILGGMHLPRLLDYGAGTGLVSLPLAQLCRSVVAMDVAPGMLGKLMEKSQTLGLDNISPMVHDLSAKPFSKERFDAILCSMTLHHIPDMAMLLHRFKSMLGPGGVLMIADLDEEDGSFHSCNDGVAHFGFNRANFISSLINCGFTFVSMDIVHRMCRTRDGADRHYPVFFASGRTE